MPATSSSTGEAETADAEEQVEGAALHGDSREMLTRGKVACSILRVGPPPRQGQTPSRTGTFAPLNARRVTGAASRAGGSAGGVQVRQAAGRPYR